MKSFLTNAWTAPLGNVPHPGIVSHPPLRLSCSHWQPHPLVNITKAFYKMCLISFAQYWPQTRLHASSTPQLSHLVTMSQARLCFVKEPAIWKVPTTANTQQRRILSLLLRRFRWETWWRSLPLRAPIPGPRAFSDSCLIEDQTHCSFRAFLPSITFAASQTWHFVLFCFPTLAGYFPVLNSLCSYKTGLVVRLQQDNVYKAAGI